MAKIDRKQIVANAPESIRPALHCCYLDERCITNLPEFRWSIFQHLRTDNIELFAAHLRRMIDGDASDFDCVEERLGGLLDDDDWPGPLWGFAVLTNRMSWIVRADIG